MTSDEVAKASLAEPTPRPQAIANRANALRPLASTIRQHLSASTICYASLGGLLVLGVLDDLAQASYSVSTVGGAVLGLGFLCLAALVGLRLIADCIRRWALSDMSRSQIKQRLRLLRPAAPGSVHPRSAMGMRIGAILFGLLLVFTVAVRLIGITP